MTELTHVLRHVPTEYDDPDVLVGLASPDDSAVYRLSGDQAIVQSVDFFTPIVDDPYDWGRIAAANALSDIYAMGARPFMALNLVGWPRSLDMELLGEVLRGGTETCRAAGVSVLGGHSVDDPEPKFGLAVTGSVHPDRIVHNTGARAGSDLVLTKPLGTGIVSSAIKEGRAGSEWMSEAVEVMAALNRAAAEAMVEVGVDAATDVTGFGLVGHLLEMLGDGAGAVLEATAIPLLPGAIELVGEGVYSGGSRRNRTAFEDRVRADEVKEELQAVLFDAQTSGGLLMSVPPDRTQRLLDALAARRVDQAKVIGRITDDSGHIEVLGS